MFTVRLCHLEIVVAVDLVDRQRMWRRVYVNPLWLTLCFQGLSGNRVFPSRVFYLLLLKRMVH